MNQHSRQRSSTQVCGSTGARIRRSFLRRLTLRTALAWVVTTMVVLAGAMAGPDAALARGSASTSSPNCGIWWGSLPKVQEGSSPFATVHGVRSGRHDCYDRLVVDVAGLVQGYDVRYVPVVLSEGKGDVVPLRGGARLAVVVRAASYDPASGVPTYSPAVPTELTDVTGFRTFRKVAWGGSFEGQTTVGLGVRARLPFRVFILSGPGGGSRLVVDVAHQW